MLRLARYPWLRHTLERQCSIPFTQGTLQRATHLGDVHVADRAELGMCGAVEATMKCLHFVQTQAVHVFHHLVEAARVPHVATRIGVAHPRQRNLGDRFGFLSLLLDASQRLAFELLHCSRRKNRVSQQVAHQRDGRRQVLASRGERQRHPPRCAAHIDLGLDLVETVLNLLSRQ